MISLYSSLRNIVSKGNDSVRMMGGVDLRSQEISIILSGDLSGEVLSSQAVLVTLLALGGQLIRLLLQQLQRVRLVDLLALGGVDAVLHPLPQLTTTHFGGSGVLHQVVDGHTADTSEPALHVSQTNVQVLADAILGDLPRDVHVQEVVLSDLDIFAADEHLVGSGHVLVEYLGCNGSECWVSNPGSVMACLDFTELVGVDAFHSLVVCSFVVLDGDLSGHSSHGVDLTSVAGLDEKLDVGIHEWHGHGDGRSVWEDKVGVLAEFLDHAEDVIPSSTVQAGGVVAELVDDLVHLKSGKDGLDQDRTSDCATGNGNEILSEVEDVVPETSLEVRFHLGEVEVWASSSLDELLCIVEEVETEIEETARDGLAINGQMLLLQVPASGSDNECWEGTVGS